MYEECWFTGKVYFKHGGSQNATLKEDKNDACLLLVHTSNQYSLK